MCALDATCERRGAQLAERRVRLLSFAPARAAEELHQSLRIPSPRLPPIAATAAAAVTAAAAAAEKAER